MARSRASRRVAAVTIAGPQARDWYSPVRVSILSRSPVSMNSGTCTSIAGLERGRLGAAGRAVALEAGLGLGDGELDRRRHLDADDLVAVHHQRRRWRPR